MEDVYEKEGEYAARPNVVSYTTVMTAMVWSGANDATEKAEKLLNRMDKMFKNGNTCAIPNCFTYSVVIVAYIKKGDLTSIENTNRILERMEAVDTITVNGLNFFTSIKKFEEKSDNDNDKQKELETIRYRFYVKLLYINYFEQKWRGNKQYVEVI